MEQNLKESAKRFKALGDEKRLSILGLLKDGEICACHILEKLSLTQSGLSYHMKILTDAGIVKGREVGKWTHYSINNEELSDISLLLESFKQKEKD